MNMQTWKKDTFAFNPAAAPVYVKPSAAVEFSYAVSRVEGSRRWQVRIAGECLSLQARTMTEARHIAETHERDAVHSAAIAENELVERAVLEADVEFASAANAMFAAVAAGDVLAIRDQELSDQFTADHRDALDEDLERHVTAGGDLDGWYAARRWVGFMSGAESGVFEYDPARGEFRQHVL